ncbi:hypoxia-inducible factor 1-alpha, partial [Aplysia californica]|uniref:Hypoxia-inducible factor 1-alpha n=1 Tax=Aplysia californica TaxID=6500 RepID=A0ABM0ZWG8_APLCA
MASSGCGCPSKKKMYEDDEDGTEQEDTGEDRAVKLRTIAKYRRDTEKSILNELIELLPMNKDVLMKQDKASLLRLAITYMKFREVCDAENADEEMEKYMEGSDAGDEDDESP